MISCGRSTIYGGACKASPRQFGLGLDCTVRGVATMYAHTPVRTPQSAKNVSIANRNSTVQYSTEQYILSTVHFTVQYSTEQYTLSTVHFLLGGEMTGVSTHICAYHLTAVCVSLHHA